MSIITVTLEVDEYLGRVVSFDPGTGEKIEKPNFNEQGDPPPGPLLKTIDLGQIHIYDLPDKSPRPCRRMPGGWLW